MGWSYDRFLHSSFFEVNEAAKGYNRKKEWDLLKIREIVWTLIQGNPYIKNEDKPKNKSDIYKLTVDEKPKEEKKAPKITAQDIKVFEAMTFNKK